MLCILLVFGLLPGGRALADTDYLIVTTEDMAPAFETLADFHTLNGLQAEVVLIADILANTPPEEDDPATLRSYLAQRHEDTGNAYVLLGGDASQIPARYCPGISSFSEPCPADLYYACHEGTWNADGDTIYAGPDDEADMVPEVALGRAPVSNLTQANTFVAKSMAFADSQDDYRSQALLLGAVLTPYPWFEGMDVLTDGATYCEQVRLEMETHAPSITVTSFYENHTAWEGSLPLTGYSAMTALNSGHYGLITLASHANHDSFDPGDRVVDHHEFAALTNAPNTSIMVALFGPLAAFDLENSILTTGIINPDGGFVGGFGYTTMPLISPVTSYQSALYTALTSSGDQTLGLAWQACLQDLAEDAVESNIMRRHHTSFTFLGDPAMPVWADDTVEIEDPSVPEDQPLARAALMVEPCYPNPFNPNTTIAFTLGRNMPVSLGVYDMTGRLVRELVQRETREAGRHTVAWDGLEGDGASAASGVYVYRVQAGDRAQSGRMVLVK